MLRSETVLALLATAVSRGTGEQLLGFWLVPGDPTSSRSNACVPPLVDVAGFVFDWSSLNDNTSAAMAKCAAAGVKNLLRLDLGPHRAGRLVPSVDTPFMYYSPATIPDPTGCPPYSAHAHNDWQTGPPVCCAAPNGTRCGSDSSPCCNTVAPSSKIYPCNDLPPCVWRPGLRLLDNFTAVWKSWLPTVKRLHAANALHGMFLGDELLLQGLPLSNLSALVNLIRSDFPRDADRKFVIYENDGYSPIKGGIDGDNRPINWENRSAGPWRVPPGMDWISMDLYRLNASYIRTFREVYETDLYPRLSPHQRVVVVPAAFGAMDNPDGSPTDPMVNWSLSQYDTAMEAIAWATYNWTTTDPRVEAIAPWHWYDDGRPGTYSYGVASLSNTRAAYTKIAALLKHKATQKLDDEAAKLL